MAFWCRALAVSVLVLACVRLLLPAGNPLVLVLAIDGANASTIERLSMEGVVPNISAVIDRSARTDIFGGSRRDPRGFWRAVFSGPGAAGAHGPRIWDIAAERGARSVVVGVPETEEVRGADLVVLPGSNEGLGFIGDNVGRILAPSTDLVGLGWPYADLAPEAFEALRSLKRGATSDWLPVTVSGQDERTGFVRGYRLADGTLYVSPAYRSVRAARDYFPNAPEKLLYVADDPGWPVDTAGSKDYFAQHEKDLADDRTRVAALLASTRPRMLVYFDSSLALVVEAYANEGESEKDAALRQAYRGLDARIERLASVLPLGSSIVLIGREVDDRGPGTSGSQLPTGFVMATDGRLRSRDGTVARPSDVGSWFLETLRIRHAESGSNARLGDEATEAGLPLTPMSFSDLGLLPASSKALLPEKTEREDTIKASSPR